MRMRLFMQKLDRKVRDIHSSKYSYGITEIINPIPSYYIEIPQFWAKEEVRVLFYLTTAELEIHCYLYLRDTVDNLNMSIM